MHHFLQKAVALLKASASNLTHPRSPTAQQHWPEVTKGTKQHQNALKHAEQLFGVGDYNAAAEVLEGAGKVRPRAWRILLQCYQRMHRFEDLCSTYESMPAEFQKEPTCRYLYVTAAANLQ